MCGLRYAFNNEHKNGVRLVDRTVDWSTDVTEGTWGRLDWRVAVWTAVQM